MSNCNCRNCLFGDKCPSAQACEYYSPLDNDSGTEEYIERERQKFRKDWALYMSWENV